MGVLVTVVAMFTGDVYGWVGRGGWGMWMDGWMLYGG